MTEVEITDALEPDVPGITQGKEKTIYLSKEDLFKSFTK